MKHQHHTAVMAAALAVLSVSADVAVKDGESFVFVRDGKAVTSIVPADGIAPKHLEFFTNAVFRCTGAGMEIVAAAREGTSSTGGAAAREGTSSTGGAAAREGTSSTGGAAARCARASRAPNRIVFAVTQRPIERDDDFAIDFPDAKTLRIVCSPRSGRWALNRILEDCFGVCFCLPGRVGTHYPQTKTVAMPCRVLRDAPSFPLAREEQGSMDPEWKLCMNQKFADERVPMADHHLRTVFSDKKYRDPAWVAKLMPEIRGERKYPANIARLWEPCFACEEGVDEAVKYIAKDLRAHPHWGTYSLGVNDVGGFCECDGCKAMNGGSVTNRCYFFRDYINYSDAYGRWCNKIAERLEKEFPHVKLGFIAYRELIDPPSFKLHRNLVPYFSCEPLQMAEPRVWEFREELCRAWSAKCESFGFGGYNYGGFYLVPRIYNHLYQRYLQLQKKYPQFKGVQGECGNPWKEGPKYWLMYKLLWNVDLDVDRALMTWYRACGGDEAAPHLKRYFDLWEEYWTGPELRETSWWKGGVNSVYFNFFNEKYLFALTPARLEAIARELTLACAATERTGSDEQKVRMRELGVWQRHAIANAYMLGVGAAKNGTLGTEADYAAFRTAFPRMQRARLVSLDTYDAITAFIGRDIAHYADTPLWRPNLHMIQRVRERGGRVSLRNEIVNQYLQHDNAAALPSGKNLISDDVSLRVTGGTLERVASANGTPRWRVTATGATEVCVRFVQPPPALEREAFFTVRVQNAAAHPLPLATRFEMWKTDGDQLVTRGDTATMRATVAPGETRPVNLFTSFFRNYWMFPEMRLSVILRLESGESAFVDSLALRIPSDLCLRFAN